MAGEPLFVGSSRHFDLRLYYVPLWLIRSTNDHRLESFIQFFFSALFSRLKDHHGGVGR